MSVVPPAGHVTLLPAYLFQPCHTVNVVGCYKRDVVGYKEEVVT